MKTIYELDEKALFDFIQNETKRRYILHRKYRSGSFCQQKELYESFQYILTTTQDDRIDESLRKVSINTLTCLSPYLNDEYYTQDLFKIIRMDPMGKSFYYRWVNSEKLELFNFCRKKRFIDLQNKIPVDISQNGIILTKKQFRKRYDNIGFESLQHQIADFISFETIFENGPFTKKEMIDLGYIREDLEEKRID